MKAPVFILLIALCFFSSLRAQTWQDMPVGPDQLSGIVTAIEFKGTDVYVGGEFSSLKNSLGSIVTNSSYIAKWNGNDWSAVGSGLNGSVTDMAVAPNGDLYVVGQFTEAGGVPAKGVARWDGSGWFAVGGGVDGTVSSENLPRTISIDAVSGRVYVGGSFRSMDGIPGTRLVAVWDGTSWSSLGGDPFGALPGSPEVRSLLADADHVYVGGNFASVGGSASSSGIAHTRSIALYTPSGSAWSALGTTSLTVASSAILDIAKNGNTLYLAGSFNTGFGIAGADNILGWDLITHSAAPVGTGLASGAVAAISVSGNTVYAGGEFQYDGINGDISYAARWNGIEWKPVTTNGDFDAPLRTINNHGSKIYAGGDFFSVDGTTANHIANFVDKETVLPVKLVAFYATTFGHDALIHWQTVSESGLARFELQRSLNGKEFTTIRITAPTSGDGRKSYYSFYDTTAFEGLNYYRLIMGDLDGTQKISKVIAVEVNPDQRTAIVFPNPSKGEVIDLKTHRLQVRQASLFTMYGKQVHITFNKNRIVPDLKLDSGIYIVRLTDEEGIVHNLKLWIR